MSANPWGWGIPGQAPDLGAAAGRARAFFGELQPEDEVPLDAAQVPVPRVEVPADIAELCTVDRAQRAAHAMGKGYLDRLRGFRGDYASAPDLVARVRTEGDVERVLAACEAHGLSCIPFGGGTSVVGGVEGRPSPRHRGALSLDVRGLGGVLEVDDVSRLARVQAGVLGPALEAQLGARGFTLRHFPQSFEFSTLGGWLATRAGGHYATGPTRIDALTAAVRMVTPRGTWQTRLVPATGAGPDPSGLVLGSEGALGVITEAWVRVVPEPRFRAQASVHFSDFDAAVAATRDVAQAGLQPSNCRLLDAQEALLHGVAQDGSAVLLLGFESADHPVEAALDRALALAAARGGACPKGKVVRDAGARARAGDAAAAWREAFLQGPYLQDAMIRLGVMADTFETACTWTAFPALYAEVQSATAEALARTCGGGVVTCRFTHVYPDGPAPYFTFVGKPRRGAEAEAWGQVKDAATRAVLRAGGTVTHHHAVGRVHRPWWDAERPGPFAAALEAAKRSLDPAAILNPGVLIPDAGC